MPEHEHHEDTTMPPQPTPTEVFPRVRATANPANPTNPGVDEATRLDVRSLVEVPDPTVVTNAGTGTRDRRRDPLPVVVSPPRAHTVGAASETPPGGFRPVPVPVPVPGGLPTATINELLDARDRDRDRDRGAGRPGTVKRSFRRERKPLSVREQAAQRAASKLRHERHLEVVEAVRAYLVLAIIFALLVIVVGAGIVGYGIVGGWYEWAPVRTR